MSLHLSRSQCEAERMYTGAIQADLNSAARWMCGSQLHGVPRITGKCCSGRGGRQGFCEFSPPICRNQQQKSWENPWQLWRAAAHNLPNLSLIPLRPCRPRKEIHFPVSSIWQDMGSQANPVLWFSFRNRPASLMHDSCSLWWVCILLLAQHMQYLYSLNHHLSSFYLTTVCFSHFIKMRRSSVALGGHSRPVFPQ